MTLPREDFKQLGTGGLKMAHLLNRKHARLWSEKLRTYKKGSNRKMETLLSVELR